jgi:outer membrane protein TolC
MGWIGLGYSAVQAQVQPPAQPTSDTTALILSYQQFQEIVSEHHPVALQAGLRPQQAEAQLLGARGAFDPYAFGNFNEKQYDGKNYYSYTTGGLKIPTWYGIELKAQYDETTGLFHNLEEETPENGLFSTGVTVAVGQGMFIDERRLALRQAQIFNRSSLIEQQTLINTVIYQAAQAYWEWFAAYHSIGVYQNALALAETRRRAVVRGAALGDRPYIDTLEAGIQVQNRMADLVDAELEFSNAGARLSVYLWAEGGLPLELTEQAVPQGLGDVALIEAEAVPTLAVLDSAIGFHPDFALAQFKIEQLQLERRWKLEQLKPRLNINYNFLTAGFAGEAVDNYSPNNYKWGVDFAFPLLLRKARGGLRFTNLKIRDAQLDAQFKQQQLFAKAQTSFNDWVIGADQAVRYERIADDYQRLVEAEQRLFDAGESSLFLVNSRENKFVEAQVKYISMVAKYRKAEVGTQFALGQLE